MWENAINCWTDLQHYRELFYQEGLDPYRVQREAQVSTHCDPQPPGLFMSVTLWEDVIKDILLIDVLINMWRIFLTDFWAFST